MPELKPEDIRSPLQLLQMMQQGSFPDCRLDLGERLEAEIESIRTPPQQLSPYNEELALRYLVDDSQYAMFTIYEMLGNLDGCDVSPGIVKDHITNVRKYSTRLSRNIKIAKDLFPDSNEALPNGTFETLSGLSAWIDRTIYFIEKNPHNYRHMVVGMYNQVQQYKEEGNIDQAIDLGLLIRREQHKYSRP